jgi:type IV pilus assembly protein PilQ
MVSGRSSMLKKRSVKMNRFKFFTALTLLMMAWFSGGCATLPEQAPLGTAPASIQDVTVSKGGAVSVVEITTSAPAPYSSFTLIDPPRVVLDVRGAPAPGLPEIRKVYDGTVGEIRSEEGKSQGLTTRFTISLERAADYQVEDGDRFIRLMLKPQEIGATPAETRTATEASTSSTGQEREIIAADPRIFFTPQPGGLNQVLGVDFTLLPLGKSRLTVTVDGVPQHHLQRKGEKTLLLDFEKTTIPPLLLRRLDSSHFDGAVDRVTGSFSNVDKKVSLAITLREMVPFHLDRKDNALLIEFGPSTVQPPEKRVIPLLANKGKDSAEIVNLSALKAQPAVSIQGLSNPKKYTGAPMTMDFVNADVTNILRLIGEVSNLNIIWGPEVKGKVSMRLKNVPWDQALDLVLANNNLGQHQEGNVIWVTTRAQLAQIQQEEAKKHEELQQRIREQEKREEELKNKEPSETRYITVNYVDVENIKDIIDKTVKGPSGRLTVDKASKTIIMTDYASLVKEAQEVAERLDKPTKQVMIEARIVEARTTFSRELGVNWQGSYMHRNSTSVPFVPNAGITNAAGYPPGGDLYQPSFSTNRPLTNNTLGLVLTTLSGSGLTATWLNTQIALAETEGKAKVLSSPKIVTRDTVKASIQQGTKLVLPSGTDANGNKTYQLVDASLKLEVTPQITPNNRVIMSVSVNDDFPEFENAIGDNVPINTKSATTTMMVASGETVIIGGILKENNTINELGQPWLRNIPILGWLFKSRNWNDSKTELLIFLTPTVLTTG